MATLAQLAQQYLNQGLPSISGIFQPRATTPVEETPVEENIPIPGITPQLLQPMGGGGGFNPYNINPNDPNVRTSRNYSPYNMRQAYASTYRGPNDRGVGIPSGILSDSSFLYGEPTGIGKALGKAVNFIPGIGGLKRGAEFLSGIMPVNRRGILENELLGGGIMLDDIGRIVTNNYNTPEGIMAGYNAAKLSPESFDKRTSNIRDTLKEKYNLSDAQIDDVVSEIEETGEYKGDLGFNPNMGTTTNLFSNLVNINKAKNIFAQRNVNAANIIRGRVEEKQRAEAAAKGQTYTGDSDRQNIVDRNTGRRDATGGDAGSKGASDQFSNKSGRGRTGY